MQELSIAELAIVGGGQAKETAPRPYDWVPNPQSEWGKRLNDASNMFGNAGGWLGRAIYDWTH